MKNFKEEILVIMSIAALAMALTACVCDLEKTRYLDLVSAQGFDRNDVRVFLTSFDYNAKDFFESKALKAQYELWKSGKETGCRR